MDISLIINIQAIIFKIIIHLKKMVLEILF